MKDYADSMKRIEKYMDSNGNLEGGPFDNIMDSKFIERSTNLILDDNENINGFFKDALKDFIKINDLKEHYCDACTILRIISGSSLFGLK